MLPQQIGNIAGEQNICDKWKSHFSSVYNSVLNSSDNVYCNINVSVGNDVLFTEPEIVIALANLNNNKSHGQDSIFVEHLKFASISAIRFFVFRCVHTGAN